MDQFTIVRDDYKTDGTTGRLIWSDGKFFSPSLERPKTYNGLENQRDNAKTVTINESCCVPEGQYLVEWTYSPRLDRKAFELMNVSGRDKIRIHSANVIDELLGCIALGTKIEQNIKHKNGKIYPLYLTSSDPVIKNFEKLAPKRFSLKITSNDTLCRV